MAAGREGRPTPNTENRSGGLAFLSEKRKLKKKRARRPPHRKIRTKAG
jgi:hypothetical protein